MTVLELLDELAGYDPQAPVRVEMAFQSPSGIVSARSAPCNHIGQEKGQPHVFIGFLALPEDWDGEP